MVTDSSIQLSNAQLSIVVNTLECHLPGITVWAYGSRVKGRAGRFSDLDLVTFNINELQLTAARESFEESALPFPVSLLSWERMPKSFHDNIRQNYRVMQSAGKAIP